MSPSDRPPRPRTGRPKQALWENITASPAPGPRSRRALFLVLALVAVACAVALLALRSSLAPGAASLAAAGASASASRRIEGGALRYTLDAPAGWRSVEADELKAVAADLDHALEREDKKGRAFVLLESMPPDLAPDPDEYAAHLVANMNEISSDLAVLADEPLARHPDSGVVHHLEMTNAGERVEGYLATLLTPRWGIRLLATAPKASFPGVQPELRRLIDSLELPPEERPPRLSFEEARRAPTRLTRRGPSPQPHKNQPPPAGVQPIRYDSGPLSLNAWWLPPRVAAGKKAPALVYLHGGFAYDHGDLKVPALFREAGFAALAPTYRGENGNPGDFELFRGELDDAIAAIRWVAAREEVDPARIYVFGHSAGGGLADLSTLVPGLPVRRAGSAGSAYTEQLFFSLEQDLIPFDPSDRTERRARLLGPYLREIRTPLHLYAGTEDPDALVGGRAFAARARRLGSPLHFETVPGDHLTSLDEAARRFLALALADAPPQ